MLADVSFKEYYEVSDLLTSRMCFLPVGDCLPPPPPPLEDPGTIPPGPGHFPPPPPLDEGAFKVQVKAAKEVRFISHARRPVSGFCGSNAFTQSRDRALQLTCT